MSKPGCFGAASVFSHDSATCRACPQFTECSRESLERLQSISQTINVSDLIKKHARAQARAAPERAQRHESDETRDTRIIQRAQPIEPIQRKTKVEKVSFEIDPATQNAIALIGNKKASIVALTLCKAFDINQLRKDLQAGINPLPATPKWLHLVGEQLRATFTRASLKGAMMNQLAWKEETASSHVSIAIALVTGLGIAVEHEGVFTLSNPESAESQ